ncbi:MAG TPA: DUF58 domain-containing protein [Deltaproteobacteria bacterium]|nr:DUF58 domain-containing protein [Deltaproteobacteria bacterium]
MADLTPEELRELRRLHVSAGRRVDSLFAGEYRSAVRGQGMEFEEVREYVPGDDVRHIDWNVTARTGEPHIKVFREERQATVLLLIDVSGSAQVGTGGRDGRTDRRLQIARIAGGLAYASIRNQDRIGLITFTDMVEAYLPPRKSRGHVWAVIQAAFTASGQHRGTDIAEALRFVQGVQRRRAVLVLVSDFLDDGDWARTLGPLTRRHKVHAVLVHDPIDDGLGRLGLIEVVDAETGQRRLVDGSRLRGRRSPEERAQQIRRSGARVVSISTRDDPFAALMAYFHREGARR